MNSLPKKTNSTLAAEPILVQQDGRKNLLSPDPTGRLHLVGRRGRGVLTVKLSLPIVDIHGYWHPDCRWPSAKLNWNIRFLSAFNRFWPIISFFSLNGDNRCTLSITDCIDDCEVKAIMNQSRRCYEISFTVTVPDNQDIEFDLHIDSEGGKWAQAVSRQVARLARLNPAPTIPADAWTPVFCTWYAAHACLTQEWVEKTAKTISELGFGTLILDDGWSYPAARKVTPATSSTWYKDVGDYEICREKFPSFRRHLEQIHAMGLKYMLWIAPFLIGTDSRFATEHPNGISEQAVSGFRLLDFSNPDTNKDILETMLRLLRESDVDGLKIDFIDKPSPSLEQPVGRRIWQFVNEMSLRLREIKPSMLIEFRESYCHRAIASLATQYRAGDVPLDWMDNFRRVAKIHLELGDGFPAHSDPAFWHEDELPENISRHMMAAISGVPMVSVPLERQTPLTLSIIRHWLDFYKKHIELFKHGKWESRYYGENLCHTTILHGNEGIAYLLDDARLPEVAKKARFILNMSPAILHLSNARYFDCTGKEISGGAPPGGYALNQHCGMQTGTGDGKEG